MYRILLITLLLLAAPLLALAHPASEAEVIALEGSGELLAPPDLVNEVEADLVVIRDAYPFLDWVYARAAWAPGHLLLGLTEADYDRFRAGEDEPFNELNDQLLLSTVSYWDFAHACHLIFVPHYNPQFLIADYEALDGVRYAEPNYSLGDGPDITWEGPGLYLFRYAWGDCPAGCLEEHFWRIRVVAGVAQLLEEWGNPLPLWVPAVEQSIGAWKSGFVGQR